ncbi:iron-containing redox enzyme family protein [Streptomyces akebiae]|uniref:Iron-containing redox enzyme family protein n=1 Tax=Streptomyces akebiae TaxID=2865673 RepID=A0ABX8XWM2_9ACTN|nr:iron-containing redox enzyme family protein [Streptomyces akebiae]QYX79566.1 iron-containing redox enzyme family protein [Streptomyces akebiae]
MSSTALRTTETGQPVTPAPSWARSWYAAFCDPESPRADRVPVTGIRDAITRAVPSSGPGPRDLAALRREVGAWSADEARAFQELAGRAHEQAVDELAAQRLALNCAPLSLVSGAWLQWLSGMANADDPPALSALALYASDVGVGHPRTSRGHAYLSLLQRLRVAEHAVPAVRTALDPRIQEEAFVLPALLGLMSRRPEDFHPEILGADLCLRQAGLLPALTPLRTLVDGAVDWDALDPGKPRRQGPRGGLEGCLAAVGALPAPASREAERRVLAGAHWAFTVLKEWHEVLRAELAGVLDPQRQAAELIRRRAREGAVYHRSFPLAGRPLATWLGEARDDPYPLLAALATSSLVRPGRPHRSPLVNGLVGEHGAMFRVFTEDDLVILRRWIASLPDDDPRDTPPGRATGPVVRPSGPSARPWCFLEPAWDEEPYEDRAPTDLREAYVLLQRRSQSPAVRRYAMEYVHGWLGRARHRMGRHDMPLPESWPAEGLRQWLSEQHDRHAAEFERTSDAGLPSRERLIESTLQLAPLTMIDGAWLQGFTDYGLASSDIGHSLFETYWDELGNGHTRLNHPLIYRELLVDMGVELPPTGSAEFARWPGFRDGSFELPVFWLSIGRFPQTFQPEVLGLNLAMELSGVGGSYRRARLALREHGFSTRFVDIHNTIDNVATGHSAWAADAIDTFMSSSAAGSGAPARETAWRRLRAGYRSLNPPTGVHAWLADRRARRLSRKR